MPRDSERNPGSLGIPQIENFMNNNQKMTVEALQEFCGEFGISFIPARELEDNVIWVMTFKKNRNDAVHVLVSDDGDFSVRGSELDPELCFFLKRIFVYRIMNWSLDQPFTINMIRKAGPAINLRFRTKKP